MPITSPLDKFYYWVERASRFRGSKLLDFAAKVFSLNEEEEEKRIIYILYTHVHTLIYKKNIYIHTQLFFVTDPVGWAVLTVRLNEYYNA